ncbi:hypothetical protein C8R47DRAFT_1230912 [Mycena vitilis]|nr:hypothetical protein C8R47DRAFT_1230912 [Mycena vitilis]
MSTEKSCFSPSEDYKDFRAGYQVVRPVRLSLVAGSSLLEELELSLELELHCRYRAEPFSEKFFAANLLGKGIHRAKIWVSWCPAPQETSNNSPSNEAKLSLPFVGRTEDRAVGSSPCCHPRPQGDVRDVSPVVRFDSKYYGNSEVKTIIMVSPSLSQPDTVTWGSSYLAC